MRALLVAAVLAAATPALAQHADHAATAAPAAGAAAADDPAAAFAAINATMHMDMSQPPTGNVDVDFLRGMIPHHEAAIAMAEVALRHSQDAEVRTMAEAIVAAQKTEIDEMKAMLARLAPGTPAPQ